MKKITLALLTMLGILSSAKCTRVDPFFNEPNTHRVVDIFYRDNEELRAVVTGHSFDTEKTVNVPAELKAQTEWQHNDKELFSTKFVRGAVDLNGEILEQEAPLEGSTYYTWLRDEDEALEEPELGKISYVFRVSKYRRPDDSMFREIKEVLYRQTIEDSKETLPDLRITTGSFKYIRFRGLKTRRTERYRIRVYAQKRVNHILKKYEINDDTALGEDRVVASWIELESKGQYETNINEGSSFPPNYRIVK